MKWKARYPITIGLICIVVYVIYWYCTTMTTIIFVRHADRDGSNDALTDVGVARADELVHVAEKSGATAIYHSGANRTRLTATPLANTLGITMNQIANSAQTIDHIFNNHRGETVMVAGHSDSVPAMIGLAGGPALPHITSTEYDNLFILSRCNCFFGPTKLVNLQYGASTP